jgi:hypothetical protein
MFLPRVLASYCLVFSLLLSFPEHGWATSFTYTALNNVGSNLATPLGINAHDDVVGSTFDSGTGVTEGFVWIAGTLKSVKGSGNLTAINDKRVAVGALAGVSKDFVSYDLNTGTLTDIPVSFVKGRQEIGPSGINSAGEVVGTVDSISGKNTLLGFIWSNGTSSELLPPNQSQSTLASINKKGEIVVDSSPTSYYNPFLYKKGSFIQIAVPGAVTTNALFITDSDIVGGSYTSGSSTSGFVLSGKVYTTYSPPGSTYSTVTGIGPMNQIYGIFTDSADSTHGFVYSNGSFYQIDVPGSTGTGITGASSSGSIFGTYGDAQGSYGYIGKCSKKEICTQ